MYEFPRSTSQRRCYHQCPLKWYHRYGHGWRPRYTSAAQFQGTVYHRTVELLTRQLGKRPIDPVDFALWLWEGIDAACAVNPKAVRFPEKRNSALYVRRIQKFWAGPYPDEILECLTPRACPPLGPGLPERLIEFKFDYPLLPNTAVRDLSPETVIPDYIGPAAVPWAVWKPDVPGTRACNVVIDFKTSDYPYDDTRAEIDEQLTDGQHAAEYVGAKIDAVGLCVLVCQEKNPQVQWLWAPARTAEEKGPFLANAVMIDAAIRKGVFPRNDQHCHAWGGCEMRPICFASQHGKLAEELEQTDPRGMREQIRMEEL